MSRIKLRSSAAAISVAAVASLVGMAGPASAGTDVAIPAGINCDTDSSVLSMAAPDIAVNWAGDAGCVGIRVTPSAVRLGWVVASPGWTSVVKRNGGTTRDRVELLFTHVPTGEKVSFRFQQGRTVVG